MSLFQSYIDTTLSYDGSELSATMLNIFRSNAVTLNSMSKITPNTLVSHRKITLWEKGTPDNPSGDIWNGGFQFLNGVTTARFVVTFIPVGGSHKVKILFNDIQVYDAAISSSTYNIDITINDKGYYHEQIITVKVVLYSPAGDYFNTTAVVNDAYIFPITSVGNQLAWGGVPTFTGGYVNQTKLNQLATAQDWLAVRFSMVSMVATQSLLYFQGTNKSNTTQPFYYATVTPTANGRKLKATIYITSRNPQTYLRVSINGQNIEYGPYGLEQQAYIPLDIDMASIGCTDNVDYQVIISERCVVGNGFFNSRVSVGHLRTDNDGIVISGVPSAYIMKGEYNYGQILSTLQSISDLTVAAYNTIINMPLIHQRARMFRGMLTVKPDQVEYWGSNFVARNIRRGDKLWVKGKGLTLMYGPITVDRTAEKDKWEYEFQYQETLTNGDAVESKYVYLDQYEGLFPGVTYFITGKEVNYVAEYLS